ncbi:MAG: hypothetical protein PUC41_00590 [Oscillospiraceae bacterium]|nr:hypothetical protein [Oscillospiraceae bacterium]
MTKSKKLFAATFAAVMALTLCTACDKDTSSSSAESSSTSSTTTTTTTSAAPVTTASTAPVEFEKAVAAESGDAFLYFNDGQFYLGYDGTVDTLLTYGAGVPKITGDGKYTASITGDTNAIRYDATGDANGDLVCGGISFAAIKVIDGTKLFPNMSIEITEIRVDGKAIEMTAKNYTSSDDGVEMRANIYNAWVNNLPEDAHTAAGPVGTTEMGEYSSQIIDPLDFASWKTIEVDFTVTGTGAEGGETTAPAEGGESSEATAE